MCRACSASPCFRVSRLLHTGMVVCLIALVYAFGLGFFSMGGVSAHCCPLYLRTWFGETGCFSRVNAAFFTVNGYVSVLFFVFWAAEILLHRSVI